MVPRIILSHSKSLRNDNIRVSFNDANCYNLKYVKGNDTCGTGTANFNRDDPKLQAFKNTEAQNYMKIYRWIKINYVILKEKKSF